MNNAIFTSDQIREIHNKTDEKIHVSCDESHAHSALGGCIRGNNDAVTICKLCETVMVLYGRLAKVIAITQET